MFRTWRIFLASILTFAWLFPSACLAATAPEAKPCLDVPYTVGKTEQSVGFQLVALGIKKGKGVGATPLIDANYDHGKWQSRQAGVITEAIEKVASVYFCRLEAMYPDNADIAVAEAQFYQDVESIFSPTNFKDAATQRDVLASLKSICNHPAGGCPEVPGALTPNDWRNYKATWPTEDDFTTLSAEEKNAWGSLFTIAKGKGCADVFVSSVSNLRSGEAPTLEDIQAILPQYLAGGRFRVAANFRMLTHARAMAKFLDDASTSLQSSITQSAQVKDCMSTVADAADKIGSSALKEPAPAMPEGGSALPPPKQPFIQIAPAPLGQAPTNQKPQ